MTIDENLDRYAAAYEPDFAYALDNDLILNWYPHRIVAQASGESLLELGVGHGYSTQIFNRHFSRHVILDGSPKIIAAFHHRNPGLSVEIIEAYFESFDTQEKFDVICMGFVLEHVDDPAFILRHYLDFLKPDGKLFVTVPNAESMHRRIGQAAGLLGDMFALGDGDRQLGHKNLFSVASLTRMVEDCGYAVTGMEGLFFKPFTTGQIRKLDLSPSILEGMMKVGVQYPELCCAIMAQLRRAT